MLTPHDTTNAPVAKQAGLDIYDAREELFSASVNSPVRMAHIAPAQMTMDAIIAAALVARQSMASDEMESVRALVGRLNDRICADNFDAIWNRGADLHYGVTSPIKMNRRTRGAKRQVKRGFRFTVEGLGGVYKLNPLRRVA